MYDPAIIARFWSKVDRSGGPDACWEWKAGRKSNGYGEFFVHRREGRTVMANAHRFAYILTHGEPAAGELVRHKCDNPPCCNPAHLERGTPAENTHDAISRGRFRPSEIAKRHAVRSGTVSGKRTAKLTDDQVRALLLDFDAGMPRAAIGRRYGINVSNVIRIAMGNGYKWVPEVQARIGRGYVNGQQSVRLSADQVHEVLRLHGAGTSMAAIARRFGVGVEVVRGIVTGKRYRWIPEVAARAKK